MDLVPEPNRTTRVFIISNRSLFHLLQMIV
jgi:hypothetical protein